MPPVHDYVIDNSTGANVRQDINNALAAIVSNNSSSSQPTTRYAYMWWADTTTGILKIRNSANDGWVELLQLDGTLTLEDGSAASPGLAFRDDLNSGVFSSAADTFNVATGGVERMELGATTIFNEDGADVDFRIEGDTDANLFHVDAGNDRIGISTSTPDSLFHVFAGSAGSISAAASAVITLEKNGDTALQFLSPSSNVQEIRFGDESDNGSGYIQYSHASNFLSFGLNGGSEKMRIDSSGRVLIGTTSTDDYDGFNSSLQVTGTGGDTSSITISRFSNNGSGANLILAKSRTGTIGNNAVLQADDNIGNIQFHGNDGSGFHDAAMIKVNVASGVGNDDMPADLIFLVNGGTTGVTERMRIISSGNVGIGVTDPDQLLEVAGVVAANDLKLGRLGDRFPVIQRHTASSGSQSLTICGGSGLSTFTGTEPAINDTTAGAGIRLSAGDPTSDPFGGGIQYIANGSTSPNNPGKGNQHVFLVRTAANTLTEKMRLDHHGGLRINTTSTNLADELLSITEPSTDHEICGFRVNNQSHTKNMVNMAHVANSGDRKFFKFMRTGSLTEIGSINTNPTATAFNTSSDYRLKENEVLISDGITRLKTLKPYRFNFKIEPDKTVDGFFAHEVASAVPEAITGEKDAVETTYYTNGDTIPDGKAVGDVKEENVVVPQSLDYAKFTPLLTAALQEAIAKIEVLETKVAALEAA